MTTFIEFKYDNHHAAWINLINQGYKPTNKNKFERKNDKTITFADLFSDGSVLFTETYIQ